uniref:Uncharacterized protein n=1 Tax=Rhizophora mucronata TaxID=61149 RepID=A0A2P2NQ13_RHIMU
MLVMFMNMHMHIVINYLILSLHFICYSFFFLLLQSRGSLSIAEFHR